MVITKKMTPTIYVNTPEGLKSVDVRFGQLAIDTLRELISSRRRCICIFDTASDYLYSTKGTKYTYMNVIDVVGYIKDWNEDTNELIIELDDKFGEEGGDYYISPDDFDNYELRYRALMTLHHIEQSVLDHYNTNARGNGLEALVNRLIGFDIVKKNTEIMK